jgi:hypothetical protein
MLSSLPIHMVANLTGEASSTPLAYPSKHSTTAITLILLFKRRAKTEARTIGPAALKVKAHQFPTRLEQVMEVLDNHRPIPNSPTSLGHTRSIKRRLPFASTQNETSRIIGEARNIIMTKRISGRQETLRGKAMPSQ